MPDAELKAVIGHEISHIKNYDIRISMLVYGLVSIIGIFSDLGFRLLYFGSFRRSGDSDERSPIGVIALVFATILAPIAASIAQMAVSREREYLADASSAKLLGSPDAMISALEKLAEHSRPMHQQNVATEALFITSPIRKSLFSSLFSTHPPLEKRIERLKGSK
jgi:heat shock protein HtpX